MAQSQPVTLTARTARGIHAYYAPHVGVELSSTCGTVRAGIDTRAGNAYVLVPPSIDPSGEPYRWLNAIEIAPLPSAFLGAPGRASVVGQGLRDPVPERVHVTDARLKRLLDDRGPRGDVSAGDYAIARSAIRLGFPDGQIAALILEHRERCRGKGKARGYIARTIVRARRDQV